MNQPKRHNQIQKITLQNNHNCKACHPKRILNANDNSKEGQKIIMQVDKNPKRN